MFGLKEVFSTPNAQLGRAFNMNNTAWVAAPSSNMFKSRNISELVMNLMTFDYGDIPFNKIFYQLKKSNVPPDLWQVVSMRNVDGYQAPCQPRE